MPQYGMVVYSPAPADPMARSGALVESDLVVSAFYVVAAPTIDVAVQIAKLHPAARDGGVEVRPLFVPAGQVQDDYAD